MSIVLIAAIGFVAFTSGNGAKAKPVAAVVVTTAAATTSEAPTTTTLKPEPKPKPVVTVPPTTAPPVAAPPPTPPPPTAPPATAPPTTVPVDTTAAYHTATELIVRDVELIVTDAVNSGPAVVNADCAVLVEDAHAAVPLIPKQRGADFVAHATAAMTWWMTAGRDCGAVWDVFLADENHAIAETALAEKACGGC
jgi:hypothetical protein